MLFHVSEEADIQRFDPRQSQSAIEVVWATDADRLRNYMVPRECPRVTHYAGPQTTTADRERFLGSSTAVLAIEEGWRERVRRCRLHRYYLPSHTFECIDECAGYFVSHGIAAQSCRWAEVRLLRPSQSACARSRRIGA
jgi:hypothetical protein